MTRHKTFLQTVGQETFCRQQFSTAESPKNVSCHLVVLQKKTKNLPLKDASWKAIKWARQKSLFFHISSTPPRNSSGWVSKMTLLKKSNYKSNYFLFLAKGSMTWTNGILFTLSLVWTVLGSKLLLQFSLSPVQLSNGGGEKKFGNSKLKLTKNLSKCPNSDSFKNCGKKLILVWWCSKFGRCYIAPEGFFW